MGDDEPREAPPLYFGDYPHGAYWSADREDAKRLSDSPDRPPWVTTVPRSPANPYPLRMFVDTGCDFALWGPSGEPPPTTNGVQDANTLEEQLPISTSLRDRLLAWAADGDRIHPAPDRDERGFFLSRELQRELGDLYSVTYSIEFANTDRDALREIANSDPLPGWDFK